MPTRPKSIDDEIDALFKLPLAEFIGARKTLATRLKKEGHADDAKRINAIPKGSISVWAVNQLYWQQTAEFERLIAAGQRFRRAHTSRTAKPGELSEALETRRETINRLSELASEVLTNAGHNPSLDTLRRIASTLEAMSAYPVLPEDQAFGRLTRDLDPPGFESLAPFIRAVATTRSEPPAVASGPSRITKSSQPPAKARQSATPPDTSRVDEIRKAKLNAAKASLQQAKKSFAEARSKAQSLRGAQKQAEADLKNADKQKREAEQRFREASAASTAAAVRSQNLTREAERADKAVGDAQRAVEQAEKDLAALGRGK